MMERRYVAIQHRFPIAVFPATLGYLGTCLLVRAIGAGHQAWVLLANLAFVPGLALLAFGVYGYLHKASHRWNVVFEDLVQSPARGSLSAAAMSVSLTGAWVLPWSTSAAGVLITIGIAVHLFVLVIVALAFHRATGAERRTCPAIFLPLVGLAVAAPTASAVGASWLAEALMWFAIPGYLINFVLSVKNLVVYKVERPSRPIQVIHLAPISLIGIAAVVTGHDLVAQAALTWSLILFGVLAAFAVKIVPYRWNPTWASFTFPLVAFVSFQRLIAPTYELGAISTTVGWIAFVVVVPAVLYNIAETTRALFDGRLGELTNAGATRPRPSP